MSQEPDVVPIVTWLRNLHLCCYVVNLTAAKGSQPNFCALPVISKTDPFCRKHMTEALLALRTETSATQGLVGYAGQDKRDA